MLKNKNLYVFIDPENSLTPIFSTIGLKQVNILASECVVKVSVSKTMVSYGGDNCISPDWVATYLQIGLLHSPLSFLLSIRFLQSISISN